MNLDVPQDFPEPKPTGTYVVPTLGLNEGTFIFSYLSIFLSYITPHDLPVELWRDVVNSKMSMVKLGIEALKIEFGFISVLLLFLMLAVIPLFTLVTWCFKKDESHESNVHEENIDRIPSVDSLLTLDASIENASINCRRKCYKFSLQILIILLVIGMTAMFVTNEEISTAVDKTPQVVRASLKDLQIFLKDAHRQITLSVQEGMNTVIERIKSDLEDIEKLLGEPIKRDVKFYTQIELTFDGIIGISAANTQIMERVNTMQQAVNDAMLIAAEAKSKITELQTQLTALQNQCSPRDRPLCETIKLRNVNENQIVTTFQKIQKDAKLLKLSTIEEANVNGILRNLSVELVRTKMVLKNFPQMVKESTRRTTDDIKKFTNYMRDSTETSSKMFTSTIRKLLDAVDRTWTVASPFLDELNTISHYIWLIGLLTTLIILLITIIIVGGLSYGYCQLESKSGYTFITSAIFICIISIELGLFAGILMVVGGHAEIFLCRTMYDTPNFRVIQELFDYPGFIHSAKPINTVLGELLRPPGFTAYAPIANASIAYAIRHCERNNASYTVFQIEGLINATKICDLNEYPDLESAIDRLSVSPKSLLTLTLPLENIIEQIYINANINLTQYRMNLTYPSPEKDITTFIDQMQRVSLQIVEAATSSRMSTLGNRVKRIQTTLLQPLEKIKNDILFHLTALEVEREPWAHHVNQTLIHLKSVHTILTRDAESICVNRTKSYKERLKNYLKSVSNHLNLILNERIATCRPLFDIFDANRQLICHQIIDPINGLWFSSLVCLFLWSMATPLCLKLATIYKNMKLEHGLRQTNSHQTPSDRLIISEQSNWVTNQQHINRSNW